MFNGSLPAVGVEDSFLAFEDIQRRAAQSAILQGVQKGMVSRRCPVPGVDDEGAVLHLLDTSTAEEMVRVGG